MNVAGLAFLAVAGVLLAALPRRYASIPLLLAAAYTARTPLLELGPANLSVLRLLVVVGLIRIFSRGERIANGANAVDWFLLAWATFLVGSSLFHTSDAWTFRLGMVLGDLGVYFLCRVFVQDAEDVRRVFRVTSVALAPLAALLILEKIQEHNYFSVMAGTFLDIVTRDGHVRAYGPFGHPILAGVVGASCVPMAMCQWRSHRLIALVGFCAGLGILFASTSSGPVMMLVFTFLGLLIWIVRDWLQVIRFGAAAMIIGLQLVMNDPVYFLMARIDLTGSSTGWFRSQLIRSSIEHLGEWWLAGTDYTRHWMATGIPANENHTDMTNHFLQQGVWGGLPLLILFVLMLRAAFRTVGSALVENEHRAPEHRFLIWTLGAMLFGQLMNFWSISLFDQSIAFFYLLLASIGAIHVSVAAVAKERLPAAPERAKLERRPMSLPAAAAARGGAVSTPGRTGRVAGPGQRVLGMRPGGEEGRGSVGARRGARA